MGSSSFCCQHPSTAVNWSYIRVMVMRRTTVMMVMVTTMMNSIPTFL